MSVFRTIRVLRPLRSIGMMPGVRILIDALIMSLPGLGTLILLIVFVYSIFGILGVQLFKGAMHNRCALAGFDPQAEDQGNFDTGEVCCNFASKPGTAHPGTGTCKDGTTCEYFGTNPESGFEHFDNIGAASIVILQCSSFDVWTEGMCG